MFEHGTILQMSNQNHTIRFFSREGVIHLVKPHGVARNQVDVIESAVHAKALVTSAERKGYRVERSTWNPSKRLTARRLEVLRGMAERNLHKFDSGVTIETIRPLVQEGLIRSLGNGTEYQITNAGLLYLERMK